MMTVKKMAILLALVAITGMMETRPVTARTAIDQEESSRGKKLYLGHCALCHGVNGSGGRGPALTNPWLRRQANQRTVFNIIRIGVDDGEMPGFWMLSDNEIWEIIQYIRGLDVSTDSRLAGDAAKGEALFEAKGNCGSCHVVNGSGAAIGPELSAIGGRRSAQYLRDSLIDPGKNLPEGYLVVSLTTKDGTKLRGVRINEDSFTIQVRDGSKRVHSLRKDELKELKKEFGISTMPGYRDVFTDAELDDLIAYLAGLREPR